jgi:hypothetical protein
MCELHLDTVESWKGRPLPNQVFTTSCQGGHRRARTAGLEVRLRATRGPGCTTPLAMATTYVASCCTYVGRRNYQASPSQSAPPENRLDKQLRNKHAYMCNREVSFSSWIISFHIIWYLLPIIHSLHGMFSYIYAIHAYVVARIIKKTKIQTDSAGHWQHWLDNVVLSMSRGLSAYLPNQQSDSDIHHRSDSEAQRILLWPTFWLGHAFNYSADLDSRQARRHHNVMEHFTKPAKSFS